MGRRLILDDSYYADQAHDAAPWMIRNDEHRVVGHYTTDGGVKWGDMMKGADKDWLLGLLKQKVGGNPTDTRDSANVSE